MIQVKGIDARGESCEFSDNRTVIQVVGWLLASGWKWAQLTDEDGNKVGGVELSPSLLRRRCTGRDDSDGT